MTLFQTVSMSELRRHLGRYLTAVELLGESFVITRYGRPVAMLVPFDDSPQEG